MTVTLTARYDVRPDGDVAVDDERAVVFIERYADEAAVEAHRASPHFARYVAGIIRPHLTARTVTVLHPLGD